MLDESEERYRIGLHSMRLGCLRPNSGAPSPSPSRVSEAMRCRRKSISLPSLYATFLALATILRAFAGEEAPPRVFLTEATINGHPVRLILDTCAGSLGISKKVAKRLGLSGPGISEPARLATGDQSAVIPIPVGEFPTDEADGVLGWPEIRRNILRFDPDLRQIVPVDQLPAEPANWLKLKLLPGRMLVLELPLTGGKMGALYLDTGSFSGIQMTSSQWRAWRAANPKTPARSHWTKYGNFGIHRSGFASANEVEIGPLTLSDVAIEEMSAKEEAYLKDYADTTNEVWSLGLLALARVNLVLDSEGGYAYLSARPRPTRAPSVPTLSGIDGLPTVTQRTPNWKLMPNVRLSADNAFALAGAFKADRADFTGAIAAYDRALELNPNNTDALYERGRTQEILGAYAKAVADYEKYVALNPNDSDYPRLYIQSLSWRLDHAPGGSSLHYTGWKNDWGRILNRFLTGTLDEQTLLGLAQRSQGETVPEQQAMACYYIGMVHLSRGDKAGARKFFQKCCRSSETALDEYRFAHVELNQLTKGLRY